MCIRDRDYLPKRFDKNRYLSILVYRKIFKTVPVRLDVNMSKRTRLQVCVLSWWMSPIYQCSDVHRFDTNRSVLIYQLKTPLLIQIDMYQNNIVWKLVRESPRPKMNSEFANRAHVKHACRLLMLCQFKNDTMFAHHYSIMWEYFITSTASWMLEYEFWTVILITIISY